MNFDWDDNKAVRNLRKHGISFSLAARVCMDENRIERFDARDHGEDRWITVGLVGEQEIVVVYTQQGETIRLVSARKAERHEREDYWNR